MKFSKAKIKLIFALATLFLAAFLGGIFTLSPLKANAATGDYNKYPANSKVGYYAEYLGTVKRQKPEVKNEGKATEFPEYGKTLYGEGTSDKKSALWFENAQLISEGLANISNATYDSMDKEGNLYLKGEKLDRKLYRHEASEGVYYGNVSDTEEAVIKKITYKSRTYGNLITGLYAPAGEVLTLIMTQSDFEASGGLKVYVGPTFADGSANIISSRKAYNRMPCISTAMNLNGDVSTREVDEDGTVTFYFGSFLGGPVYLKPVNGGSEFTVTISGGVRYSHFILGYTTEEEFKINSASSAPYFDLEVWDRGVRHSGPEKFAHSYSYAQLYNAAVFWEKVASLSNQFPSNINKGCGIDFVYDPFVTTQLIPQNSVNCPDGLLAAALDYGTISAEGCNDILSKYNSRFTSGWGLTNDGVSGDAITLIAYSLFTEISSKRSDADSSEGLEGLSAYSSASLSLRKLKAGREDDLPVHSTVIHSFGQDLFIQAAAENINYTQSTDRWFNLLVNLTKRDMTYYFTELCKIDISKETLDWAASLNYPMFVPAACIYQTGEVYGLDGENISVQTMQPYIIEYDTPFEFDFDKVLELPYGFSYKIKCVTPPENGSIQKLNSHTYIYNPQSDKKQSGKIYVKIGIERDDKSFEVEDKILILEFRQKQTKTRIVERSTYTYTEGNAYTGADEAFKGNYGGYESVTRSDNPGSTDGLSYGNADILPNAYTAGTVIEVRGKYFVPTNGNYRVALRGSGSGALYLSSDGKEYSLAATFEGKNHTQFSGSEGTYSDLSLNLGSWLYFKEVLLVTDADSFLCLGIGKFEGDSVTVKPLTGAYRSNYFAESEQVFVGDHRYKDLNNSETVGGISGFTRFSPDDDKFAFSTGWTAKQAQSTFGHIYEGGQNSVMEFTFYGTQFALFSDFAASYGEYEIYIDGNAKPVKTVNLGAKTETAGLAYLSNSLTVGSHTVTVKGKSGTVNIDSISLKTRTDPSTVSALPDLTPDEGIENEEFRKPVDHPEPGDGSGGNSGNAGNSGGQNAPGGGNTATGLIVSIAFVAAALITGLVIVFLIDRKKNKQ